MAFFLQAVVNNHNLIGRVPPQTLMAFQILHLEPGVARPRGEGEEGRQGLRRGICQICKGRRRGDLRKDLRTAAM